MQPISGTARLSITERKYLMDKIFITNLSVRAIIGVNDWERQTPQDIVVNVAVYTKPNPAARTDDIKNCIDYAELVQKIRTLIEEARRFTVEALAEDIAAACLEDVRIQQATIRVEKSRVLQGTESVGVEIERSRS
jgi:7,8-dihydroneopterin aldolase/epimerase/oxygenase